MPSLEVIVYGGGEIFREFFNAIALSMGSSGYESLIKLSLLIAGVWALVESITKRNLLLNVKWLVTYLLVFYALFLPKASIHIIDRIESGKPYAVDNVPLGLAIFASYTTRIGDGLTRLTEQYFSMPDYQPYGETGMVMASRMVKAAGEFQITDPKFSENMQGFIQQCVFYDLLLDKYSARDLIESTNIWQTVSERASPARSFIYNSQVTICQDGAKFLNKDWTAAIQDAEERYAHRLFPKQQQLAKQELLKRLPMSYAYLTKISAQAASIMQQNMMASAIKYGLIDSPPYTAAIEAFSFAKAQTQKRLTNATIGDMAAYWLPIMKIVFECIMYGSFVFIFLLALFPFGLTIVKHYLYSLMWIQIWAPLYAIINLIISYYAQTKTAGAITANGLTLASMSGIAQINSDIAGMAGYISISVPFISIIVVKGMASGFTQLAQYIGGVTQTTALGAATEIATGNLSLGNTNFANHNAFNTSANHFDTSARMMAGTMSYQLPTGSAVTLMPDGTAVLDNRNAISSLGTSINLSDAIRASSSKQSELSYNSAVNAARGMVDQYSAGIRTLYDFGASKGHSASDGSSSSVSKSGGFSESASQVAQLMSSFEKAHHLNKAQSSKLFGAVYGDLSGSFKAGTFAGVGGSLGGRGEMGWGKEVIDTKLFNEAKRYAQDHNFSHLVDSSLKAMHEDSYRTGSEHSNRVTDSVSSSFDQGNSLRDEATASYQKSQSYREMANISDEHAASINNNANQQFVNWLSNQQAPNTHGKIGMYQAENMRTQDPESYQHYAEQFVREKTQDYMTGFGQQHIHNQASVADAYTHNAQNVGTTAAVQSHHDQYKQHVAAQVNAADVGQNLNDGVTGQTNTLLKQAQTQIEHSDSDVSRSGKKVERAINKEMSKM